MRVRITEAGAMWASADAIVMALDDLVRLIDRLPLPEGWQDAAVWWLVGLQDARFRFLLRWHSWVRGVGVVDPDD